jgi:hypothetical protein
MRVRSLDVVRLPEEERYLISISLASVVAVRKLWEDEDVPVDRALACTSWVWRNVAPSPLDWVRSIGDRETAQPSGQAFARYMWLWLAPMALVCDERHEAYRGWVHRDILEPLLPANADVVDAVAQYIGGEIEQLSMDFSADASETPG